MSDVVIITPNLASYFFQTFYKLYDGTQYKYGLTLFSKLLQEKSTGWIKLKSKNPFEHPIIEPNYLQEQQDVEVLLDGEDYTQSSISMLTEFYPYPTPNFEFLHYPGPKLFYRLS